MFAPLKPAKDRSSLQSKDATTVKSDLHWNNSRADAREQARFQHLANQSAIVQGVRSTAHTIQQADEVIQGNFKMLNGEQIQFLVERAKELRGEDLDPDYLEGLYVTGANALHLPSNPILYMPIGKIQLRYLTGNLFDTNNKRIFVRADTEERAKDQADIEENVYLNPRSFEQVLAEDTQVFTLQEHGPYSLQTIRNNVVKFTGGEGSSVAREHGRAKKEALMGSILTGGESDNNPDAYGTIEFRFIATNGVLQIDEEAKDLPIWKQLMEKHKGLRINPVKKAFLKIFQEVYAATKLPHPEERMGNGFLFVADDLEEVFLYNVKMRMEEGQVLTFAPKLDLKHPFVKQKLPANPGGTHKNRERSYIHRAGRGSRGTGQAAAMGGWSAGNYVKYFNPAATKFKWEWLHIQGSRLGGPNSSTNLVAGTDKANTAMIPYERAIYRLSKTATGVKPVKVKWSASLKKDETGAPTHVGDHIRIEVSFPNGYPPKDVDGADPKDLASPFPVNFNILQGAPVTKLERDITEVRSGKNLE